MAGRALRVTSRIAFIICGLTSLFTAVPYVMLHGESLPRESEWIIFVIALALVGLCSTTAGMLPRSWIAKACKRERDDDRLFSAPLKLLGIFAAIFYVIAVCAYFSPHTWNLDPQFMLVLCPLYFVKMTIDPAPVWIFFVLAPMNAGVYGALGAMVGYVSLAFHNRH